MQNIIISPNKRDANRTIDLLDRLTAEHGHGDNAFKVEYFTRLGVIEECPFDTVFLSDTGKEALRQQFEIICSSNEEIVWA